jgi:glycosyltransferase involved in cell wall biosynthesis
MSQAVSSSSQSVSVLYLSYDGLTDPLGQSQVLPYILGLAQRGFRFTIVSTEKPEAYARRKELIRQLLAPWGDQVDWQPIFYTKRPPVLSTLWDVWQMRRKAEQLHRQRTFQIVHCRSYITALVGEFLQKKYSLAFIFDMRGFWADERVEGGLWKLSNPVFRQVYQFFKRKEKDFLRQADHTISLTVNARQEIQRWPGFEQTPIQVIPCCVDTNLFQNSKFGMRNAELGMGNSISETTKTPLPNEDGSEVGIHSAFRIPNSEITISYLGSLGTWYLLDEMLLFFKRLLHHRPGSQFLFITPDDPAMIRAAAVRLGIPESRLRIQKAERQEVPVLLAQSQLSVFFIKPSYSKKASSPTKMGEILAMGIPVICNANVGDANYLMETYPIGGLVHEFSEAEFDRVIGQLDTYLQLSPESLRQTALSYFELQKGVDLYEEVYRKLLYPRR